jgi:hypothetical protein
MFDLLSLESTCLRSTQGQLLSTAKVNPLSLTDYLGEGYNRFTFLILHSFDINLLFHLIKD